jgi:hypothetical protein
MNVIRQWDDKIFPDSESSLVRGKKNKESGSSLKKAMDLLAADSEEAEDQAEDQVNDDGNV